MLPSKSMIGRLESERNIWLATVRPSGRPHLVPIWFVWHSDCLYFCIKSQSVKAKNLANESRVSLALEDGSNVVVCEGEAAAVSRPWPGAVARQFEVKYDWTITADKEYDLLVAVQPVKWLTW